MIEKIVTFIILFPFMYVLCVIYGYNISGRIKQFTLKINSDTRPCLVISFLISALLAYSI
jgi:hypothetical protein